VLLSENERYFIADDDKHDMQRARKGVKGSEGEEEEVRSKVHYRRRQKNVVAPVGIDHATQATLDYIGENLDVRYNVVGNDGGRFHVDIVLANTGDRTIPSCCWAIYLYHMKYDIVLRYLTCCNIKFT